jgi:hypothetical protein
MVSNVLTDEKCTMEKLKDIIFAQQDNCNTLLWQIQGTVLVSVCSTMTHQYLANNAKLYLYQTIHYNKTIT